jgi:hypothetical protein
VMSPVYKRNSTRLLFLYVSMWLEYTVVVTFIDTSWKTDCEKAKAVGGCMPRFLDVLCTRSPLHVADWDQSVREVVR